MNEPTPNALPTPAVAFPPQPRHKCLARLGLIVLMVLWGLLLIPAVLFALMSPFAFDSGTTPEAWRVFYLMISFPFVLVGSIIFGWVLYAIRLYLPALLAALLPVIIFLGYAFIVG